MDKKINTELKQMIGKFPENWNEKTIEEKLAIVFKKWSLLSKSDMYDLELHCYQNYKGNEVKVFLRLEANEDHHFTKNGACFALEKPITIDQFPIDRFPEYLRPFIEENGEVNYKTDEVDYNVLSPESKSGTFVEAIESMYLMLDLLTCGYKITEVDWYKEENKEFYPDYESDEDDWFDDDDDDDWLDD